MTETSTPPSRNAPNRGVSDGNGAGTSAMDLVCRRMPLSASDTVTANGGARGRRPLGQWFRRSTGAAALEPHYSVTLPNPRYPQPPPPVIHHHGVDHLLQSKCWGDSGSHTTDLALNVMAAYFPHTDGTPGINVNDGSTVSELAYRLHRTFKFGYLVRMPDEGGVIAEDEIRRWLALQLVKSPPHRAREPGANP
jgi:hypothetical protein